MALVIAIAGPTGAGKSTLTTSLQTHYSASMPVFHIPQDSYYFPDAQCVMTGRWVNWDHPDSLRLDDWTKDLDKAVEAAEAAGNGLVLVEGVLLFSRPEFLQRYHGILTLTLPMEVSRARRFQRDGWIRENAAYYEEIVLREYSVYGTIPAHPTGQHSEVDASLSPQEVFQAALIAIDRWRTPSPTA